MCFLHLCPDIIPQALTQENIFLGNFICLITKAPDLIVTAGSDLFCTVALLWVAVSVQTHDRAEASVLKPADVQTMEIRVIGSCAVEAADISGPPRNTGNCHVKTCLYLTLEALEGTYNITRPYECTIFRAACPGRTDQADRHGIAFCRHAVIERFQIIFRINISDLLYASELITVVLEIINAVFRLCHIQPEEFGTLIIIIFLDLLPDIRSCIRVGCIEEDFISTAEHRQRYTVLRANQIALLFHLLEVFGINVNGRPYRHNNLNSHLL